MAHNLQYLQLRQRAQGPSRGIDGTCQRRVEVLAVSGAAHVPARPKVPDKILKVHVDCAGSQEPGCRSECVAGGTCSLVAQEVLTHPHIHPHA